MVRATLRALLEGPHAVTLRRFVIVGAAAAGVQTALLAGLVEFVAIQYLPAAVVSIETTIILQYFVNNAWTFRDVRHTTGRGYLRGLAKTNLVRGSAIPIQVGVLAALVAGLDVMYLVANAVGIGVSGVYRYLLDRKWTWDW